MVCEGTREGYVTIAPDGTGGALVAWGDDRGPSGSVYAQRIDEDGNCLWQENGVCLRSSTLFPDHLCAVSDGEGGAIVVWEHFYGGMLCVLAQKVDSAGAVCWGPGGVEINCRWEAMEYDPSVVSDGEGGAIVAWTAAIVEDTLYRTELRVQRMDHNGDLMWGMFPAEGVLVAEDVLIDYPPLDVDGEGGAIVGWTLHHDIFAQRFDAAGIPLWSSGGVSVCTLDSSQWVESITRSVTDGWFAAWRDGRNESHDIYAQRIDSDGAPLWTEGGVPVCLANSLQGGCRSIPDGRGGVIVFWIDLRNGRQDIYCQRVESSGNLLWEFDGVFAVTAIDTTHQLWTSFRIIVDSSNGAMIVWKDYRTDNWDIYCQRVDSSGTLRWGEGGLAVCTNADYQAAPVLVRDGEGGAIMAWCDNRAGGCVYVQRVGNAVRIAEEPIPPIKVFSLEEIKPNPFIREVEIFFSLSRSVRLKLAIYDVRGRLVRTLVDGERGGGEYRVKWDGKDERGKEVTTGTYFILLEATNQQLTKKAIFLR